jgi:hypothetical protein
MKWMKENIGAGEIIGFCGTTMIGFGVWEIYPPAGYIAAGCMIFATGLGLSIHSRMRR